MELSAKQQYKLAHSIERGRRLTEAIKARTNYDEYCEITSFSDYEPERHEEFAQIVEQQWWREDMVAECAAKFIERYKGQIAEKYFEAARVSMKPLDYLFNRPFERFCYFNQNVHHISCCMQSSRIGERHVITDWLEYRRENGHFPKWHDGQKLPTKYKIYKPTPEQMEQYRAEFIQLYGKARREVAG